CRRVVCIRSASKSGGRAHKRSRGNVAVLNGSIIRRDVFSAYLRHHTEVGQVGSGPETIKVLCRLSGCLGLMRSRYRRGFFVAEAMGYGTCGARARLDKLLRHAHDDAHVGTGGGSRREPRRSKGIMDATIEFKSHVPAAQRAELEALLFFNTCQGRVSDC